MLARKKRVVYKRVDLLILRTEVLMYNIIILKKGLGLESKNYLLFLENKKFLYNDLLFFIISFLFNSPNCLLMKIFFYTYNLYYSSFL